MTTRFVRRATGAGAALIVLAGTAGAAPDAAGPPPSLHISLEQAVAWADTANPGILAARARRESAKLQASSALLSHFGEIDGVAWASRYEGERILQPISKGLLANGFAGLPFERDQVHYGLNLSVPLFVGGKLNAAISLAGFRAEEAAALLAGSRWQVKANVVSIYAANQALDAAAEAYAAQLATFEKTRERLQLMVDEGKRPNVDLLKVTETLEESRAELAQARAQQEHARAVLAALLDLPPDQRFTLDPISGPAPELPAQEIDWNGLLEKSAAVRAAALRESQAEAGKHVQRGDLLPQLSFNANLLEHSGESVAGPQQTWELTLGAKLPLFAWGHRIQAYRSAAAAQRAAAYAHRQTQRQQQAALAGAIAAFRASREALAASRRRVAAGDEAARIEELRYDTGASTIEDLLRARTRQTAARAALARAQGEVAGAAARVNALVEKEIIR